MAKSSRPAARPPRAPKGEDPAVTIANMAREIDNLIQRVADLVKERDDAEKQHLRALLTIEERDLEIGSLNMKIQSKDLQLKNMMIAGDRSIGWQDCAREVFAELISRS